MFKQAEDRKSRPIIVFMLENWLFIATLATGTGLLLDSTISISKGSLWHIIPKIDGIFLALGTIFYLGDELAKCPRTDFDK